jgi:hypothetical protein
MTRKSGMTGADRADRVIESPLSKYIARRAASIQALTDSLRKGGDGHN